MFLQITAPNFRSVRTPPFPRIDPIGPPGVVPFRAGHFFPS